MSLSAHKDGSLKQMKSASSKAFYDLIVSEISNRIDIPLGFDFDKLHAIRKSNGSRQVLNTIFGANLTFEGICQMNLLVGYICSSENIIVEGLFRKNGSRNRQNQLVELLASGTLDLDFSDSSYSIHDVCCVLKRFISELPEPLLTHTLRDLFFESLTIQSYQQQIDVVRLLILLLPEVNQAFLHDLFKMFDKIVKCSTKNLMPSSNLSTIFSPMFFYTADTSAEVLKNNLGNITKCLQFMIDNSDKLFTAPESVIKSANVFMLKWNSSNKLMSTTTLIPHARMCASVATNEPSDYTKQQMALLMADLQKTVNDPNNKKNKKFSGKRQKELLSQATNQSAFGTPLVKLERDKRQQELIKQQMSSKKAREAKEHKENGLKDIGTAIKKKFFTPRKYHIQGSATFVAKKRRSMDFKETLMDRNHRPATPAHPSSSRLSAPKLTTGSKGNLKPLDFSEMSSQLL